MKWLPALLLCGIAHCAFAAPPSKPLDLMVTVDATSTSIQNFILNWSAPASDGGSPILTYRFRLNAILGSDQSSKIYVPDKSTDPAAYERGQATRNPVGGADATTHAVKQVSNNNGRFTWTFQVAAENADGIGEWSDAFTRELFTTVPGGAPQMLTVDSVSRGLLVRWQPPAEKSGALENELRYFIEWRRVGVGGAYAFAFTEYGATTYTIRGLTNGREYDVRIKAGNVIGLSLDAHRVTARGTPEGGPDAPTDVRAVAAANQVTLQWTAPASDGGSAITGYRYRWSNDSDANTWESAGGAAGEAIANSASLGEYLIGSLTNGVHYVFQVAAQNATATGDWSASVRARPLGLPGVPSGVSASAVNEGLVVRWAGGSAGGASGSARRYQVRWRLGSAAAFAAGDLVDAADAPDTLSHVLGGLSNGSEYVVQVRAKTLGGESAWSADARGTPSGFNFAMLDGVAGASSKDGILAARYLAGARGGALSVGLGLAAGVAETAALNIAANLSLLDVDGNNATNAADGIMIARYMLGVVSGAGLYEGQADAADVDDVIANIQALLPQ